jgi:hypothetical protein
MCFAAPVRPCTLAQGVDRNVFMDIAIQHNHFKRFLRTTPAHGFFALVALLNGSALGKQPNPVFMGRPVFSQGIQCEIGQGHVTIFASLAIANMHPVLLGIDITDFQVKGFTQAQTHAVGGEDIDLVAQLAGRVDDPRQFIGGENIRQGPHLGRFNDIDPAPLFVEYMLIEKL